MATSIRSATPTRTCSRTWSRAGWRWRRPSGRRPRQAYQAGPAYPKGQPNASRRDAWPPEGGRPGSSPAVHAEAVAGREQHPARHPEPDRRQRRQLPEPRVRRRRGQRDEPLGRGRVADRAAPEGLDRGAVRGRRRRGGRDRALGRRSALRPGADGHPHRQSARPEAGTGRSTRPPRRPTCRSACTPSASAATRSPAAAGRRSTSRTWSATPSRASPSSPAW